MIRVAYLRFGFLAVALAGVICCSTELLCAQSRTAVSAKLPSAEKVVDGYLKAIGGKKRVAALRDATYDWKIQRDQQQLGTAKQQTKAPVSVRSDWDFGNGRVTMSATPRSVWAIGVKAGDLPGEKVVTLTGDEAGTAKLGALLHASHLLNYKKNNVLSRVVSAIDVEGTPSYVVEFSQRSGARLKYVFSAASKLLIRIDDDVKNTTTRLEDYRLEGSILVAHRITSTSSGTGKLTFSLQRATYNRGIDEAIFDPPRTAESVDVPELLRQVSRNQDQLEQRFTEYSFTQKETERQISGKKP